MSDQSRSALVILRWASSALLALLLLLVWIPADVTWRVLTGLLWLAGSWLLTRSAGSEWLVRSRRQARWALASRAALVVLAGLLLLVAQLYSVFAAVVLAVAFGMVANAIADARASRRISDGAIEMMLVGVMLVVAFGVAQRRRVVHRSARGTQHAVALHFEPAIGAAAGDPHLRSTLRAE